MILDSLFLKPQSIAEAPRWYFASGVPFGWKRGHCIYRFLETCWCEGNEAGNARIILAVGSSLRQETAETQADAANTTRMNCHERRRTSALALGVTSALALCSLTLVQPNAAANMRPLVEFEWAAAVSLLVFLINFPINLLAYSALLMLLCHFWGRRIGKFPREAMEFLAAVLLIVLLTTALGVVIDFLFLYSHETTYVFRYDLMKWLAALAAVGLSVHALTLVFLRADIALGALPALGMVALNLASWWFAQQMLESSFYTCVLAPSLTAGVLSAVPLAYLEKWHRRTFQEGPR